MKIAFLADTLDRQYAGIHIYTYNLLRALIRLDHENQYYLVRPQPKGDLSPAIEIIKPIYRVPGHQSLRLFWDIPRTLARQNMDLVIEPAHFGPFNLPKRIKRITFIHDLTTIKMPQLHVRHSQLLQRMFLPGILRRADRILVNSNHTRNDVLDYLPGLAQKTDVIYAGKDDIFYPRPELKASLDIKASYFLYVGTLEPRKNLLTLLTAYQRFRDRTTAKTKLVFIGKKGWQSKGLMQAYQHHPYKTDIVLKGYVDRKHLPVWMSNCLAFIYPSLYEGFGLPVLEAMACGAPVIVADNSSLREISGDAALLFEAKNVQLLTRYLLNVQQKSELRQSLSKKSLQQAKNYTWERSANLFLNSLNKL